MPPRRGGGRVEVQVVARPGWQVNRDTARLYEKPNSKTVACRLDDPTYPQTERAVHRARTSPRERDRALCQQPIVRVRTGRSIRYRAARVLTDRGVLIGIAAATIATTVVFLAALAIAALRRWRGAQVGRAYGRSLAFLAGVMFGTMNLVGAADCRQPHRRGVRPLVGDPGVAGEVDGPTRASSSRGAALPWSTLWRTTPGPCSPA